MSGINGIHPGLPFPFPVQLHPEIAYRDYLRKIWTDGIQHQSVITPNADGNISIITEVQALSQLRDRFHQDFTTAIVTAQPANELLIGILLEILKSPIGGGFGFGLPATSIPSRGSTSAKDYVQKLLTAAGQTAEEMSKRYRTQFVRPTTESSNAVWENVYTLQAFYRDSFQAEPDPAHPLPDVLGQPIIPSFLQDTAPFFLDFEEWTTQQQKVPLENYFLVRDVFKITVTAQTRSIIQTQGAIPGYAGAWLCTAYEDAFALNDLIVGGVAFLDQNNYPAALTVLNAAHKQVLEMFWAPKKYGGQSLLSRLPTQLTRDIATEFGKRAAFPVKSFDQLSELIQRWQIHGSLTLDNPGTGNFDEADNWIFDFSTSLLCSLTYAALFTLPVLVAQASIGTGDFTGAIRLLGRSSRYLVGLGSVTDTSAWSIGGALNTTAVLYQNGSLPYTTTSKNTLDSTLMDRRNIPFVPSTDAEVKFAELETKILAGLVHPVEALYFRLQLSGAMLDWADSLFRTDDKSSIARARELYKGVYILWGKEPGINPEWVPPIIRPTPFPDTGNPAKLSQLARAKAGFTSIGAGLNFFGFSDDMVPMLRYSTLKSAADVLAADAKAAETDFLNAISQFESATIENLKNSAMLQRANLQVHIAQQQALIAGDQIQQAQVQVALVQNQITAQESAIADHDSFWGQLGDYFSGLSSIVGKAGPLSGVASSTAATETDASAAALAGPGTGALVTAGIGAWFVASYLTLSSMASAQDGRQKQLANLQTQNLPFAQAGVDVATRSQTIANLQSQVASVDAQLATQLIAQADLRFLSTEFWNSMALLMQRIFRQYLTLATRTAWLAERALVYDTGSESRIIRQNYYSQQSLGAGGAEELQVDLATLDASRLNSIRELVPIKYTVSLGRDFPLQFGQLLVHGSCTFFVQEQHIQAAFPGTYGYRLISASPRISRTSTTAPIRGMLSNNGISEISSSDGSMRLSIRAPDALPISEFDSRADGVYYGLPGLALMQFEGSGVQSNWTLEFPSAANPAGFSDLMDVLITFDMRAQYDATLARTQLANQPTTTERFVILSALKSGASGLQQLQTNAHGTAMIAWDVSVLGLSRRESGRKINNIFFALVGPKTSHDVTATVKGSAPAHQVQVTLTKGIAFSTLAPITDTQSTVAASPLNIFGGGPVEQTFSITFPKDSPGNSSVQWTDVTDVLLGIDYAANVV